MTVNLTKLKRKINPDPDGQGIPRLKTGVVSAIASDGTVDITMNGATVADVPVLGSAVLAVGTVVQVLSYRGSMLILGGSNRSVSVPVSVPGSSADSGTTTSDTYVTSLTGATLATAGAAFIAPPSGTVYVMCKAAAQNDTVNDFALVDFQVRQGSTINAGTVVRATNDNTAGIVKAGVANQQATIVSADVVTGLTPGAAYNVTMAFRRAVGGTASYNRRHALVLPQ